MAKSDPKRKSSGKGKRSQDDPKPAGPKRG